MRLQSLKVKLVACFFAISLSAAIVGFMANSSLGRVGALLDDATSELVPTMEVLGQLRFAFSQALYASHKGESSLLMRNDSMVDIGVSCGCR